MSELSISPAEIPAGMTYQWVARAVCGDQSLGDEQRMRAGGWRPVPLSRHPSFKLRSDDPVWIEIGGLLLMERPEVVTRGSQAWEQEKARTQLFGGNPHEVERQRSLKESARLTLWRATSAVREKVTNLRGR